jgi:ankyrin repeat protein
MANISKPPPSEGISSKSLMKLPNELLLEVGSHLQSFEDFNSLVRTSTFFHGMFKTQFFRRAIDAEDDVLDDIMSRVLGRFQLASLVLLLDHGLSVNRIGCYGINHEQTMLHFLCEQSDQKRSIPLARLLIQRGADLEAKDMHLETVLYSALERDKCEIAVLLLADGADPNSDNCGDTPLNLASRKNNVGMVYVLLACGAAIDGCDAAGDTPLLVATRCRAQDVIPTLLSRGADAGAHNKRGDTPLHYAASWLEDDSEHHQLAKLLLEHGAFVNATNNEGETPLHFAFDKRAQGTFMAKFLLDNGADVNAISRDGRGHSPLQRAISRNNEGAVALLLERGADIRVLDSGAREKVKGMSIEREEL